MNEPDSFINFKIPKGAPTWAVGIAVILIIVIGGMISLYKVSQSEWKSYIDNRATVLAKEGELKQEAGKIEADQIAKGFEQKDKEFALIYEMVKSNMTQIATQNASISALQLTVTKQGEKLDLATAGLSECQKRVEACEAKKGK